MGFRFLPGRRERGTGPGVAVVLGSAAPAGRPSRCAGHGTATLTSRLCREGSPPSAGEDTGPERLRNLPEVAQPGQWERWDGPDSPHHFPLRPSTQSLGARFLRRCHSSRARGKATQTAELVCGRHAAGSPRQRGAGPSAQTRVPGRRHILSVSARLGPRAGDRLAGSHRGDRK